MVTAHKRQMGSPSDPYASPLALFKSTSKPAMPIPLGPKRCRLHQKYDYRIG